MDAEDLVARAFGKWLGWLILSRLYEPPPPLPTLRPEDVEWVNRREGVREALKSGAVSRSDLSADPRAWGL